MGDHKIPYKDRAVGLGKYVVGIDFQRFTDAIGDQAVQSRIQELGTLYKDKVVIIGVDRMDFTKGLPEKLEGFRVFLDECPEWSEKVVLIQIAIPSREEVKEYKSLEEEVSKLAGQIIGKHGRNLQISLSGTPAPTLTSTSYSALDAFTLYSPLCLF